MNLSLFGDLILSPSCTMIQKKAHHYAWFLFLLSMSTFIACSTKRNLPIKTDKLNKAIHINCKGWIQDYCQIIRKSLVIAEKYNLDTILFEPGHYCIDAPIVPIPGIVFKGSSRDEVIIEQTSWGHPAFDIFNTDVVSVSNMTIRSAQERQYPNGFVQRGTDGFVNNAGIYSNSNFGSFTNLNIQGFTCGLHLSSWSGKGLYDQHTDNYVDQVMVGNVDFGLLATGQKKLVIQNFSGSYKQQHGSGAPPHLIYISDANDPNYVWSENLTIKNCYARDSKQGRAYQIGSVIGGQLANLNAIRCSGILAIKNVIDITIDTLIALEDSTHAVGSIFIQPERVENIEMKNVVIECLNPEARLLLLDGKNSVYRDITLRTNRKLISDFNLVVFVGENSVLDNINIINENDLTGAVGIFMQGVGLKVNNISCLHCRAAVNINEFCKGCDVRMDKAKIIPPLQYKDFKLSFNWSSSAQIKDNEKY